MLAFTYVYKCYQKSVLWNMNDIQFNEVSLSRNNSTVSPFKQYAFCSNNILYCSKLHCSIEFYTIKYHTINHSGRSLIKISPLNYLNTYN